ncbi:MAG: exostosin family protein [Pseudomonadota bacterium]
MKIHLCAPYFLSGNEERQAEFDECLAGNIANPYISQITIFVDDAHAPNIQADKLRIVDISRRLTYKDWLEFSVSQPERTISVLSNTDILFDDTIAKLIAVFRKPNRFVALSRHERLDQCLKQHPDPKWSQDVWAIDTSCRISAEFAKSVDFPLGVPRCDNKLVYEAAVHGWDIVNPFPTIRAIHLHESQVRNYHKTSDRTLIGGMGFASACADLNAVSSVELSVWPLKTNNITSVRVIDALESWDVEKGTEVPDICSPVVSHNDDWQFPAITEKHALDRVMDVPGTVPADTAYFGFPWATLIDKLTSRPRDAAALLRQIQRVSAQAYGKRRRVTVCQHIHLLRFQKLFADAGITDIFWSHKTIGQDALPDHPNIRLHAFPLYPVQAPYSNISDTDDVARTFLFSFVGARARDFYLTDVRTLIQDELADHPNGYVVGRGTWHYNKIVYDHQILKKTSSTERLVDDKASAEFAKTLAASVFSLCPSGSGPNSIRLWESLGMGAIPVIMADTLDLPGPRALWEQAAVFCSETREAVKALPDRLQSIAHDEALMAQKRHAGRQLWALYGPGTFIYDILLCFAGADRDDGSVDGERSLPLSDSDFLELAEEVRLSGKRSEADFFVLMSATSHALTRPKSFSRLLRRFEALRRALKTAAKRCEGEVSAAAWTSAERRLKSISDCDDNALTAPVLSVMTAGRSANRLPLAYSSYRHLFNSRLQIVDKAEQADILVFGASANIREYYKATIPERAPLPEERLVVISEEPLWDTTWGLEFEKPEACIIVRDRHVKYTVLNHLTSDIFKFEKIPYFVTTDDHYVARYANMFRRNTATSAPDLLKLWRTAPIRQAYFAERREEDRYNFERLDLDLVGHCAYRTRIAIAAPHEGTLRVGQGWTHTSRRQDLPDWHLDKLTQLDRRTFICSALENTHLPDYITEKPFDAFAVLGVPVYAANPAHRIREIIPEGSFINVWGMEPQEAADHLRAFKPDLEFAERYLEAQKCLTVLFGDAEILRAERRRVVNATLRALEAT